MPPTTNQLDNLQIKIKESLSELIEKGLDIDIPTFEIETENRILSLSNNNDFKTKMDNLDNIQ